MFVERVTESTNAINLPDRVYGVYILYVKQFFILETVPVAASIQFLSHTIIDLMHKLRLNHWLLSNWRELIDLNQLDLNQVDLC